MLCGGGGQDLTLRGGAPEGERIQHPAKAISRQLYVGAEPRRALTAERPYQQDEQDSDHGAHQHELAHRVLALEPP